MLLIQLVNIVFITSTSSQKIPSIIFSLEMWVDDVTLNFVNINSPSTSPSAAPQGINQTYLSYSAAKKRGYPHRGYPPTVDIDILYSSDFALLNEYSPTTVSSKSYTSSHDRISTTLILTMGVRLQPLITLASK